MSINSTFETSTFFIDKQFWDYFDGSSSLNVTFEDILPRDQGVVITTYGILMAIGGLGNLAVLVTLARSRRRKSRVDLLMTHLAVADVCVTCGVIPLEIGWKYTNAWLAGNMMCKVLLVMRAFGLYLSSNVLVCISLDRYFAVVYPLRLSEARRRSKQMLYCAWAVALACSLPQSLVFRVKRHPYVAGFEQCVSFDAFASARLEIAYNVFCACAMYFVPLLVITACYVRIFCEIQASSKELTDKQEYTNGIANVRLRRSDRRVLERARQRTLRMTLIIVFVFALCWLPYATMAMWYMVDRDSASRVPAQVQDLLFAMAVSNSCMNPLVYGTYTLRLHGSLQRLMKTLCCMSGTASDTMGTSRSSSSRNKKMDTPLTTMKNGGVKKQLGVRFAETSLSAVGERGEAVAWCRAPA
ncbi:adipokinetic hormone/corazonin-related peptide receptor variant I-like [Colias croceus]|uniref:adipokinetic hormone/corazonin-related peptide receptor variant I-like n=1 Tax=Colias crocea TaxID=72248 RepID=UPI001E280459|nr:adipokinetic hormone/corazonin-related peptide receptor variant I-like [Colias croceus]